QTKINNGKYIYIFISTIIIIISIQVILTELSFFNGISLSNFSDHFAKGNMNIPLGASNLIACFLLPLMIFLIMYKKNFFTLSVFSIGLFALLLCRSKNALILFAAICLLFPLYKIIHYVIKDSTVSSKSKLIFMGIISLVGFFFGIILLKFSGFLINDLSFNYFSSLSNPFLNYLDRVSSGRVTVYSNQLVKLNDSLFWGNGYGYSIGDTKSHNWIIDILVQKGVIGTFIYLCSLIIIFKTSFTFMHDKFVRASLCLLSIILVQGLFEISLFTSGIDFLFWSTSGLLMSRIIVLKSSMLE
ncbi:hypothetical protein, partial [Exiguobacterium sp.]|uniref:O-antigen ligase family protein n=1 Tax=Exiguobacterium sp. TaxID=44751 RepID=UPI0028A0E5F5